MSKKGIVIIAAVVVVVIAAIAVIILKPEADSVQEPSTGVASGSAEESDAGGYTDSSDAKETDSETEADTDSDENAETDTSAGSANEGEITVDEALQILYDKYGTEDVDTGFTYSYGYTETDEIDGVTYYNFRMSWLVDNDHFSYLTNLFVSTDGSKVYSGAYDGNGGWELDYE